MDRCKTIGLWGDGAVSYLMACVLRAELPDAHLVASERRAAWTTLFTTPHRPFTWGLCAVAGCRRRQRPDARYNRRARFTKTTRKGGGLTMAKVDKSEKKKRKELRDQNVKLVLDVTGAGYSEELEQAVRDAISNDFVVISRGHKTDETDPDLRVALTLDMPSGATMDFTSYCIKTAIHEIREAFLSNAGQEGWLSQIRLVRDINDIEINLMHDGKFEAMPKNFVETVVRAHEYIRAELDRGHTVTSLAFPNKLTGPDTAICGEGDQNLWKVRWRTWNNGEPVFYDSEKDEYLNDVKEEA